MTQALAGLDGTLERLSSKDTVQKGSLLILVLVAAARSLMPESELCACGPLKREGKHSLKFATELIYLRVQCVEQHKMMQLLMI